MINMSKKHISNKMTHYKPRTSLICCTKYKDKSNFRNILQELELTELQKQIISIRYLNMLENFQRRSRNYSYIFFGGHFIITVGSLFVPALLSIQNSDTKVTYTGNDFSVQIYWSTFVISLLVTIFNGIITLFKVDKKYYFLNTTLERLRSEGWQYFSLTGRYSGHLINNYAPTHSNQFLYFTHYIEKIKLKQVEEEYYKAEEKISQAPNGNQNTNVTHNAINSELYPPSPDQPLNLLPSMHNIPEPVKEAVNTLIKSHMTIDMSDKEHNVIIIPKDDINVLDNTIYNKI
jgi:hypothetical protein